MRIFRMLFLLVDLLLAIGFFKNVSTELSRSCPRLTVVRPEEHVNKAVAHGAIYFFINHYVHTRMSRATYGIMCSRDFDKNDPEHLKRSATIFLGADGKWRTPGAFSNVLGKGKKITEVSSFRGSFVRYTFQNSELWDPPNLYCYSGSVSKPRWRDLDPDNFTTVCHITADMSQIPVDKLVNPSGKVYYQVAFDVVLSFGLIEMTAQIAWREKGVEKRGPAAIVYDHEPSDRISILIKDFRAFTVA